MPTTSDPISAALASKKTGWRRVYLRCDAPFDFTSVNVQATNDKQAAELALAQKPGYTVSTVKPTTNPARPKGVAARLIADSAYYLLDSLKEDVDTLAEGGSFEDTIYVDDLLPGCYARHYDAPFVERFLPVIQTVTDKLIRRGPDAYLASTAEELAAHVVLYQAEAHAKDDESGDYTDDVLSAAYDRLREIHEVAFEDWDVLMLFEAPLDGIQDSPVAEMIGMANPHLADWFKPFREGEL